jgi:hypothetical protein
MPDASIIPVSAEKLELGSEWQEAAELAAHNLGFPKPLLALSPEHWQMVLASVTDRMRLRGASLPIGWRRALARQVGRGDEEDPLQGKVFALAAKRKEIAAHVALELGLGDLAGLSPADRVMVEQQTTETIEGCGTDSDEASDCSDADRTMRRLLSEHRALAEEGGVSTPKDNA